MGTETQKIHIDYHDEPERKVKLHITRRGKKVVAGLAGAAMLVGMGAWTAEHASTPTPVGQYTVLPGDTLWTIAEELDPNSDPRDIIDDISQLNPTISAGDLQPGQTISVPLYSSEK